MVKANIFMISMASLWHTYCRPGVSRIHGVGLFAVQPIKKGAILMPARGLQGSWKTVEWAYENSVEPGVIKMMQDYICSKDYCSKDYLFVPSSPITAFEPQMLMNHSLDPNVRVNERLQIEATCDIRTGDELTENYIDICGHSHMLNN